MLLKSRHIKCLRTKSLVFKDWEKTRTTVEERAIIEAEHSPVNNINESTKAAEKQTGNSIIEIDLRHSNLKCPNQPQNFNFPGRLVPGQYKAFGKKWFSRTLGFTTMKNLMRHFVSLA